MIGPFKRKSGRKTDRVVFYFLAERINIRFLSFFSEKRHHNHMAKICTYTCLLGALKSSVNR